MTEVELEARRMAGEAVESMGGWVAEMRPWDTFGGLTYDPKRQGLHRHVPGADYGARRGPSRFRWQPRVAPIPLVHREAVEHHVKSWVRECASLLDRRLEYVIALERQKNTGQWHAHPLLDCGGVDQADRNAMGRLWYRDHGISRLEEPRNVGDVALYASKYLVKDFATAGIMLSPGLTRDLEGRYGRLHR